MKLEPSFPDHWKTRRLVRACGAEAVLGLLRLWGQAQIKREYRNLPLTASKLAAVMEYQGDQSKLWEAMTDLAAPWLDPEPDGTWTLHGFADHQHQIIRLWEVGKRGGRPKSPPVPPSNNNTSSSSSSCPIWEPKGNHMVVETPSLEEVKTAASMMGVEENLAEIFFNDCEARPIAPDGSWTGKDGQPLRNWRNALKAFGVRWKANENGRKGPSTLSTKPLSVWEAKEKKKALQDELERMKGDRRWRQSKAETPWQTEWNAEGRAKAQQLREKIRKLEEVIAA